MQLKLYCACRFLLFLLQLHVNSLSPKSQHPVKIILVPFVLFAAIFFSVILSCNSFYARFLISHFRKSYDINILILQSILVKKSFGRAGKLGLLQPWGRGNFPDRGPEGIFDELKIVFIQFLFLVAARPPYVPSCSY